jgi:hypothetical protein
MTAAAAESTGIRPPRAAHRHRPSGGRPRQSSRRSLISTATGASQGADAERHDAEITDLTQHRRRAYSGARLSAASAASVRDAAIAVSLTGSD